MLAAMEGCGVRGLNADSPAGGRPVGYPHGQETDVVLAGGRRMHLRPVVPGDVRALQDAIGRAAPETLHRRFLGGGALRTPVVLRRLVELDYRHHYLGATGVSADFFSDNVRVQRLVAAAHLPERRSVDHGVVTDAVDLRPLRSGSCADPAAPSVCAAS